MNTKVFPPEAIYKHWNADEIKSAIQSTEYLIMNHFIKRFKAESNIFISETIKVVGDGYPGKIKIFYNDLLIGIIHTSIDSDKKNYRTILTQ